MDRRWSYAKRWLITVLALVTTQAVAQLSSAEQAKRTELFNWFDAQTYGQVRTGQFVRFDQWQENGGKRFFEQKIFGFRDPRDPGHVLSLFLDTEPVTVPEYRCSVEPLDLKTWLREQLQFVSSRKPDTFKQDDPEHPILQTVELFVLARAATARGLADVADQVYKKLENEPLSGFHGRWQDFAEQVKYQIPAGDLSQIVDQLSKSEIPRSDAIPRLRHFIEHYPYADDIPFARDALQVLQRMAVESARPSPEEVQRLPLKDRIAELIVELEDQPSGWGGLMIPDWELPRDPHKKGSAALQLIDIGYPAVPQLLGALKDRRFTRGSQGRMHLSSADMIPRVREVVLDLLEAITCQNFGVRPNQVLDWNGPGWSREADDKAAAAVETTVRAWWAMAQVKGEERTLIEGVRSGGSDSDSQTRRLVDAYPQDALPAITEGVRAAKNPMVVAGIVQHLQDLPGTEKLPLVRHELIQGGDLNVRVTAAEVLRQSDPAAAIDAMIAEWDRLPPTGRDFTSGREELIQFLGGSGRTKAIDSLAHHLRGRAAKERDDIMDAARTSSELTFLKPLRPQTGLDHAVEALLAGELEDTDRVFGMGGSYGNISFSDPRLCEMAAMDLMEKFPHDGYAYVSSDSRRQLERQRILNLNVWRKKNHLPLLPVPQVRPARTVSLFEANTVHKVEIKGLQTTAPTLVKQVRALKGTLLSPASLQHIESNVLSKWPAGLKAFRLSAYRDDDGAGFKIVLDLTAPWEGMNDWDFSATVRANGVELCGEEGSGSIPPGFLADGFDPAVAKALVTPPLQIVDISFAVSLGCDPDRFKR